MVVSASSRGELLQVSPSDGLIHSFGAEHPPIATVNPGQRILFETELNMGPALREVSQPFSRDLIAPWPNPATGPIAITGATPEHALICDIEDVEVLSPGVTALPEMRWPRLETESHIAVLGCARLLEDAFRIAVRELVAWMHADYGMTIEDAVMLLGQVAEARATQIVNPKYTYIVKIARRWLPASGAA
jgi:acetamidase/formamidase